MVTYLYNILTSVAQPLFHKVLEKRVEKGKELPERLHERKGAPQRPRPQGPLIWFHGASVGESLSALPVIEKILHEYPQCHVMVTTGTVTSARLMEKRLGARAFHQFMPLDHPKWVKRFVDHWQPDAVIWLESDFWPNMLGEIKRRQIPAVLLNSRMGDKSFQRWSRFGRGALKTILATFDMCLAQSADEKARLDHFDHPDVRVADNLKFAAARLPVDEAKTQDLSKMMAGRPAWLFASTHPGEEEVAIETHKVLKAQFPDLLTVIVPRHPNRGPEIEQLMSNNGLHANLRSRGDTVSSDTDIYIADTMGEMGIFFDLIDLTVIGGSFVKHGGHNPIEPGQFGNMIIYGPHMFNFKLICEVFEKPNAALPVSDSAELAKKLSSFLNDPDLMVPYKKAAFDLTQEKSVAMDRLWGDLSPWLSRALQNRQAA